MIAIALVFGVVVYKEWMYLKSNNRKPKTKLLFITVACILMLGMEVIYLIKEKISLGMVISSIFSPIQRMLFAGI